MRASGYQRWLDLQQRWRESDDVLRPSDEIASELRSCLIELLREICADSTLEVPYEVLFQLANQLEILHAGSKATFLLPDRFETSIKNDPTYKSLKNIAAQYVLSQPDDGSHKRLARKQIEKEFGVAQQTVSKWLSEASNVVENDPVTEALMRNAGAFYQTLRSEEKARSKMRIENELDNYHT